MTNLFQIAKGVIIFIGFYIAGIILNYIVPVIISAMSAIYVDPNISGIVYVGLMFIWVVGMLVLPNIYILEAIKQPDDINPAIQVIIAITMFFFGLILTVKGWYFITAMSLISSNVMVTVIYWLGVGIMWFEIVLGIPAYIIMRALEK